jgi:hypothetical protein
MAEPNVIVNPQTTNVVITRENLNNAVVDNQIIVTDASKPANLSITTVDPNSTANTQSINISTDNNIQLVNISSNTISQPIDTQNVIVFHGTDISVIAADKGGPPGPPPTVVPDQTDPYKIYIGGVEFSLPAGPAGPIGPSGAIGPQGPAGDLSSISFGTGNVALLTYDNSSDILKIVGSGITSINYDNINKKITISSPETSITEIDGGVVI